MEISTNKTGFITGVILTAIGIFLLFLAINNMNDAGGLFVLLLYGAICLGLGIYLIFHLKQENIIEGVKPRRNKK